jgi:lipopolysaccharide biosynthesis regulator YciM
MKKLGLFFLVILFILPFIASAETIVLKSGQTIEGKLIEKTDKDIKIDFQGVPITYFLDEVESIDGKAVNMPKVENMPVVTQEEIADTMDKESRKVLDKNPESAKAYNDQGVAIRMNGDHKQAIEYFSKAIEIDPNYAEAYNNRGLSYASSQIGNFDLALSDFSKVIELNPNDGDAYFLRANLYFQKRDYDKTWEDINKVKSLGLNYYSDLFPQFLAELQKASGREK